MQTKYEPIYAITTDGRGGVFLEDVYGERILAQRQTETESDDEFRDAVISMLESIRD